MLTITDKERRLDLLLSFWLNVPMSEEEENEGMGCLALSLFFAGGIVGGYLFHHGHKEWGTLLLGLVAYFWVWTIWRDGLRGALSGPKKEIKRLSERVESLEFHQRCQQSEEERNRKRIHKLMEDKEEGDP